jgi:hypothetical protein
MAHPCELTEGRNKKNLHLIATLARPFLGLSQNGNEMKNGVKSPFYLGLRAGVLLYTLSDAY